MTRHGQAAGLDAREQRAFLAWVETTAYPLRNEVIARLSFECALRATEIGRVEWWMAFDPTWRLRPRLQLHERATKGGYGARKLLIDPLGLGLALERLRETARPERQDRFIVEFRKYSRDPVTRSHAVQAFFREGYREIGCLEASSHSGRRTAITRMERVAGLRAAQVFAGHRNIATTARYVDPDYAAIDQVVREQLVIRTPRLMRMAKATLPDPEVHHPANPKQKHHVA